MKNLLLEISNSEKLNERFIEVQFVKQCMELAADNHKYFWISINGNECLVLKSMCYKSWDETIV